MHRLVAQEFIDNLEHKAEVDHIDKNKHNNCILNLRWAASSENNRNKSKQKGTCSSNIKGVSWHRCHHKWTAQVNTNTVLKCIGYFLSEIDAAQAYNDHAERVLGAFANLNIL